MWQDDIDEFGFSALCVEITPYDKKSESRDESFIYLRVLYFLDYP